MSYIENNVLVIIERVSLHPLKLVMAWIWGILGFWLLLIPLIKAIKLTIYYNSTEMVITNRKVIEKYGWISVHCDEMSLNKIENITVESSFWGGLFGYGDVIIQGANRNNINFKGVSKPEQIRKIIDNSRYQ